MVCNGKAALVRTQANVSAQPFTLVVVVVLCRQQLAPGLLEFPGWVDIPLGIGAAEEAQQRRQRLRCQRRLLGRTAQAAKEVAIFANAHAVEDIVHRIATRLGDVACGLEIFREGDEAHVEIRIVHQLVELRQHNFSAAHPIRRGHQLKPLDDARHRHLAQGRAREQRGEIFWPLVQVELVARRRQQPRAVHAFPPNGRNRLPGDFGGMPGPLEVERGVAEASLRQDLGQLGKEVEFLFPEGARAHAEQAQCGTSTIHTLAYVGLATVKQAVRLAIRRADDLDLATGDGRTQVCQRFGRLGRHLLVAGAFEVDVALGAGLVAEKEHVTHRAR